MVDGVRSLAEVKANNICSPCSELAFSLWFSKRIFALGKFMRAVPDHCLVSHEFVNGFCWICSITLPRTKVRLASLQFPSFSPWFLEDDCVFFVFSNTSKFPDWYDLSIMVKILQWHWSVPSVPLNAIPSQPTNFCMSRWLSAPECIFLYCGYCFTCKDCKQYKEMNHIRADSTSFKKKRIKKA